MSKLALSFRVLKNDQLIREDTLVQGVIKIGKVPSAHLQIDDESVSRMHAIIEVTAGEVSLIDLGSTRGTFVNGKKINKAALQSGDVIGLGAIRVEVAIAPAEAPALAAIESVIVDRAQLAPPVPPVTPSVLAVVAQPPVFTGAVRLAPPPTPPPPPAATPATASIPAPAPALASPPAATPATASIPASAPALASPPAATPATASIPAPAPARAPLFSPAMALIPAPVRAPTAATALALPLDRAVDPAAFQRAIAESADDVGGARAVEVAAMLGDSVIAVKHCMDPRGGRITPATWAWFAAGLACLLASTIAFTASVRNAADDQRRRTAWHAQHRPAHAYRPYELGAGVDWVAFGGLALGLFGVTAGLWRMRGERTSPYYRIGTAPGVEMAVEDAPAPDFPLVAPSGDDFVFNYGAGIDGELLVDGTATPLAALAAAGQARPSAAVAGAIELPIPARARIRARAGGTTFVISPVARPRRHAAPLLASLEGRVLAYAGGSLAVHLVLLAILQAIPPDASGVSVITPTGEDQGMRAVAIARLETPPERTGQAGDADGSDGAAAPMALAPGAAGDPEAAKADGRMQVARTDERPHMSRDQAIQEAIRDGILGSEQLLSGVKVLGATSNFASGFDLTNVTGPLYGGEGPGRGVFGGGVGGDGPGGGCTEEPCGTIGVRGRYDTIATGIHAGDGYRLPGDRGPRGRGHVPSPPRIGDPTTSGAGYDKTIVRRYIRRNIDKIAYCYERQLLAHPGLGGEIAVTFLISSSGVVQRSLGSGFDREVASCVAAVIQAIQFPAPGDGGTVQVNYPFQFRAAGQ